MSETRLNDKFTICRYLTGGDATFTLVSTRRGTRYNYEVIKTPGSFLVFDPTKPDTYLGLMSSLEGAAFNFVATENSPTKNVAFVAFKWFIELLNEEEWNSNVLEFWHNDKCSVCGRELLSPNSKKRGMDYVCANNQALKSSLDQL